MKDDNSSQDVFFDWAYDGEYSNRRTKNIAIGVAILSVLIAVVAIGSVSTLLPLKEIEPIVITISKETGIVNVISDLKDDKFEKTDATVFSEAGKYLTLREGYFHPTYVENYKKSVKMSVGKAKLELVNNFAPDGKRSPMVLYGDKVQINLNWISFSFISDDVLSVRFQKEMINTNDDKIKVNNYIATLKYEYVKDANLSLKMRIFNPHAFVVTDYQIVLEGIQ